MHKNFSASRRLFRQDFSIRRMLFPLAIATLLGAAGAARAQGTSTWDGGGANNNWQTAANWSNDVAPTPTNALIFAGTTRLTAVNDYAANTQFNGISFASGAGSFTLSGNAVNLGGDIVNASGSTQTISLALVLLQNTNYTLTTGLTDSGVISGGFGLTKTGAGTLTLSAANTYSGATTVNSGGLTLSFATVAANTNVISNLSALVLGSNAPVTGAATTLTLTGKASTVDTQAFNGTTFAAGNTIITPTAGTSGTMTLDLGAITHTVGSGAVTQFNFTSSSTTVGVNTTVGSQGSQGILGAWARIGTTIGSLDYASVNGSGNIVAVSHTGTMDTASLASNVAANYLFTAASTNVVSPAVTGTTDVSTVQFIDPAARTIDIGANNILRLGASGGIWRNVATTVTANNGITIQNGTLTAGGAANTAGEIVFTADGSNVGGASTAGSDLGLVNTGITVNSVIADNGTLAGGGAAKVSVTKNGAQTVQFSGPNTYTGNTYVQEGRLISTLAGNLGGDVYVTDGSALAPGQVVLLPTVSGGTYANNFFIKGIGPSYKSSVSSTTGGTGGALVLRNGATVSGTVTLLGASRISGQGGTATTGGTITGQITGNYALDFGGTTAFALGTITLNNQSTTNPNNWTGDTTILSSGAQNTTPALTLVLGSSDQIPDGVGKGNLVFTPSSITAGAASTVSILNLNGKNETINGLSSTLNTYAITKSITGTAASTLTVGNADASATFVGVISGAMSLTKIGAGTQTFGSGFNSTNASTQVQVSNTYSGTTTINGGKLSLVNTITPNATTVATGYNSATGTSAVNLNGENTATPSASTTTLMGTGYSSGLLTVTAGGRIAPGVNTNGTNLNFGVAGTLTLGDGVGASSSGMTLTNANLDFDLASAATGTSDRIATTGALTLGTVNFTFNELTAGTLDTTAKYTLISGATSEIGALSGVTGTVIQGDYTPTFSFAGNDLQVSFAMVAVPEPSTWVMGSVMCAVAVGAFARRRYRRAC